MQHYPITEVVQGDGIFEVVLDGANSGQYSSIEAAKARAVKLIKRVVRDRFEWFVIEKTPELTRFRAHRRG